MTVTLGATSRAHLVGVHPDVVRVVLRAAELSDQDFTVFEGLRSVADQLKDYAAGRSKLKFGKHQPQPADGLGHAVDLVPWINGAADWDWPAIYRIAAAMALAAHELGVAIRWGGVWDRALSDLVPTAAGMAAAEAAYRARHAGPDFVDGPHFELA